MKKKKVKEIGITALYERLSRDDDGDGDSNRHRPSEANAGSLRQRTWLCESAALYGRWLVWCFL